MDVSEEEAKKRAALEKDAQRRFDEKKAAAQAKWQAEEAKRIEKEKMDALSKRK